MIKHHNFSERYIKRKQAVMNALSRESSAEYSPKPRSSSISVKVLAVAAALSALTVGVFAATRLIEFSMERDGDNVYVHAGLNGTGEGTVNVEDKPLRSWNIDEGGVGIRLMIPDLPADMGADKTAPGKYGSEDSTRSMTVNGVDLRRSDLDQIIGGVTDTKQFTAGNKPVYVAQRGAERYDRIAYVVFEEDDLVLKLWVSHGISDDELVAMVSTLTIEYTTDTALAIPVLNELGDSSTVDIPFVIVGESDPVYVNDLARIGESVRDKDDRFTVRVEGVEIYDDISTLDPDCIIRDDIVDRFTDEKGALIPYNRTQIVWLESSGKAPVKALRESVSTVKKLYVMTLDVTDIALDDLSEEDRDIMLRAFVNSFCLNSYTLEDDEINIFFMDAVVDQDLGKSAGGHDLVYREDLGDGKWRVAYLIDEDIAEKDLVLGNSCSRIYVKIS